MPCSGALPIRYKYTFAFVLFINFIAMLCIVDPNANEAWADYIRNAESKPSDNKVLFNEFYCSIYPSTNKQRIIYTDYPPSNIVRRVLEKSKKYTFAMPGHHIAVGQSTTSEYLSRSISLFLTSDPNFHNKHIIGLDFLCEDQFYNHIPGNGYISRKDQTVDIIRATKNWEMIPYSLNLSNLQECLEFITILQKLEKNSQVEWMVKNSLTHRGEGISLINYQTAQTVLEDLDSGKKCKQARGFIAQKYIQNPLLVDKKKVDVRVFLLIASTSPLIPLYHDGFIRKSTEDFSLNSENLTVHLTNTKVAAQNVANKEELEGLSMSIQELEDYLVKEKKALPGWKEKFRADMKYVMNKLVQLNIHKMVRRKGLFELYGLDFMIDSDLNTWFIELNLTPNMVTSSPHKTQTFTEIVLGMTEIEFSLMEKGYIPNELLKEYGYELIN